MPIRMIGLDIDGTLLTPGVHHEALPDPVITQAVAQLQEAGVVLVLATGRMYPGTVRIARHLGIEQPLICQQGALTHAMDGTVTRHVRIDPDIAHELALYAQGDDWPYGWFDSQRYLASTPNQASQYFADVSGVEVEYHDAPEHSGVSPIGIDIISTQQHAAEIHKHLDARYGDKVQLLDFSSVTAAHSPDASKGNALALLAADMGIEASEVLAVGDSVNDVSMLQWAGHGAAPGHCDRYARGAADEVLDGEGVTGVGALLNHVLRGL